MMSVAMTKRLISLLTVLFLTACVSTGNPWDRPSYGSQAAQSAPSPLQLPQPPMEQQPDAATPGAIQTAQQIQPPEGGQTPYDSAYHTYPPQDNTGLFDPPPYNNAATNAAYPGGNAQQAPRPAAVNAAPALPPVKVGLLVPLSGPHADLGEALLQAAQLALFDSRYDSLELVPRDTKGTAQGARQAAEDAVNAGAQIILGPLFADSVRAARPVASRRNISMVAFSTDWTLAGGNTYIMGFLPFAQVQRIATYARQQGLNRIAILAPNDNYGNAVISAYNSLAYRGSLPTADVVRYPVDDSDISGMIRNLTQYDSRVEVQNQQMRPLQERLKQNPNDTDAAARLAKLRENGADAAPPFDAILLPTGGEQLRSIANMLSYYDLGPGKVKRLGTGLWDDSGLAAETSLRGSWYAAPDPDTRATFEMRYNNTYGHMPPRLATLAYDATALAAVIARNSYHTHGRPVFNHAMLANPNGFAGIDGIFRFRPDGLVERGLAVLEIRDGRTKVIDPAPKTFQAAGMHR